MTVYNANFRFTKLDSIVQITVCRLLNTFLCKSETKCEQEAPLPRRAQRVRRA